MIQLSPVRLGHEEEELVLQVIRSGHLAQGPMVARLEEGFVRLTGSKHAVAVSSGTTALILALESLGIGPGDEVMTTPFTFAATLNAILSVGAVARFADIRPDDLTMDPDAASSAISSRTAAIMPVHLYGLPADMEAIAHLAHRHGVPVVEDAAQAVGASVAGQEVGSFGLGCFSFYATKNLTTGEGGMITTDNAVTADRLRMLRNQGMRQRYRYEVPGHNGRMTDLQAAIGLPQLARLGKRNRRRQKHAEILTEGLDGIDGLLLPSIPAGRTHVFHQYTVRLRVPGLARDDATEALREHGVDSGVYYPKVVYDYECYRTHPNVITDPMPEAQRAASEVLSLPVHPWLDSADLERIVEAVRAVAGA